MDQQANVRHAHLSKGRLFSIKGVRGTHLICRSGRLLVSIEGVTQDFDLRAGQSLELSTSGLVVMEAIETAHYAWRRGAPARSRHVRSVLGAFAALHRLGRVVPKSAFKFVFSGARRLQETI